MPLKSGGLKFNGTSDYVDLGKPIIPTETYSIELWFKTSSSNGCALLTQTDNGSGSNRMGLWVTQLGNLAWWRGSNLGVSTRKVNDGLTHHVVATKDLLNNIKVYLDGQLEFTLIDSLNIVSANTIIGKFSYLNFPFQGTIGATRIYNRALSPTEVYNNYQGNVSRNGLVGEWLLNQTSGTVATDTSGNGNHGVLNGGQWMNKAVKMKPKKNLLLPVINAQTVANVTYRIDSDYSITVNSNNNWSASVSWNFNLVKGTQYTLSSQITTDSGGLGFDVYRPDGTLLVNNLAFGGLYSFNADTTGQHKLRIKNGLQNQTFTLTNPQLEQGSTATPFEPYTLVPDLVSVKTPLRPSTTKRAIKFDQRDYSFSRQSNEPYNGLIAPMDTPRVDGNGVIVEEGTSNLLPSVGQTGKNGTSGFSATSGATLSVDSSMLSPLKNPSIKVVSDGTALYQGIYQSDRQGFAPVVGNAYVGSVWLKGSGLVDVYIRPWNGSAGLADSAHTTVNLTDQWTKISTSVLVAPSNATSISMLVRATNQQAVTFWCDGFQIEQKSYPTSFTETTRQPEALTFPTANVLNASEGTIEVWAYEDGVNNRQAFMFDTSNSASLRFLMWKNPTTYEIFTNGAQRFNSPLKPVGWHLYTIRWSGTMLDLLIDGVKQNQSAITIPAMGFDDKMYIGSRYSSSGQWNSPIKSLRISNKARTDQEIADSFNQSQAYMHLKFDDNTTKLLNF